MTDHRMAGSYDYEYRRNGVSSTCWCCLRPWRPFDRLRRRRVTEGVTVADLIREYDCPSVLPTC